MPYCLSCGSMIDEYDSGYYARNMNCIPCYTRKMSEVPHVCCERCGVRIKQLEAREMKGGYYCNYCFSEKKRAESLPTCPFCKKKVESWQKGRQFADGRVLHEECAKKMASSQQGRQKISSAPSKTARESEEGRTLMSSVLDRLGSMIG